MNNNIKKLTKGWKNMVDVQPGFYEGVDRYEQAWKAEAIIKLINDKITLVLLYCSHHY